MKIIVFRTTNYGEITYTVCVVSSGEGYKDFESKEQCVRYLSDITGLSHKELKDKGLKFNINQCVIEI